MAADPLLPAALGCVQRGWAVFPIHGIIKGRCTCGHGDCSSPGKHPLTRHGLKDATTDGQQLRQWWTKWPHANIGLATGEPSGNVVIDIDLPSAIESLDRLVHKLPGTLTGLTGGGGVHLIYRRAFPIRCTCSRLPGISGNLPGIDLRADDGYIVAPPSLHLTGTRYSWLDESRELAVAPSWLKQPLREYVDVGDVAEAALEGDGTAYGLAVLREELDRLRAAQVGTRNHELNRSTFVLAQLVAGGELVGSAVRDAVLPVALSIGLQESESCQTIESAFTAGLREPR